MREDRPKGGALEEHYAWPGSHWTGDLIRVVGEGIMLTILAPGLAVMMLGFLAVALVIGLFYPSTRVWLWPAAAGVVLVVGFGLWRAISAVFSKPLSGEAKAAPLPRDVVETYADGRAKRVVGKARGDDGGEITFEYGFDPHGEMHYQIRPGGKICQRVLNRYKVGIYCAEITGSELDAHSDDFGHPIRNSRTPIRDCRTVVGA